MNKTDKIILIFYIFLASSFGLYVLTYDVGLEESLLEVITPKKITEFETSRLVDISNTRIFDIMANVENFPNVLPENVVSVNILSKTDNEIIAEEELSEAGIKTKLLVKHTIKPYSEHIIEIIDGDAEGTKITQYFESVDSQTKLTTKVDLNVKGITSLVAFVPEGNLVHAINTVISHFVEYSKYDVYEITVNSIYQEILNRQADDRALSHFSVLLRDGQITEQDLRSTLLDSEEGVYLEKIKNVIWKTVDELDEETISVISDLYRKILLRQADPEGLQHYGSLLESGFTLDEIETMFLESAEGKNAAFNDPVRGKIIDVYKLIFDEREPSDSEVDHYHKMIIDGYVLVPDWVDVIISWERGHEACASYSEWKKQFYAKCDITIPYDVAANAIKFLYNEGIIFPFDRPSNEESVE